MYQKEHNTTKLFEVGVLIHQNPLFVYMWITITRILPIKPTNTSFSMLL